MTPRTALVLAGGLGTRIRGLVSDRSKVVAPFGGVPFLSFVLDRLADAGCRRAVLCTGHLAESVESHFGAEHAGMSLAYSREEMPLGTGGALRRALASTTDETLLCVNGDSWCDADLRALAVRHHAMGAAATLLAVRVPDAARYGRVEIDAAGNVSFFVEKGEGGAGLVNAGVYVLEARVIRSVPEGRPVSLEREILPEWIGHGLKAVPVAARFVDMGTPEGFSEAQALWAAGAFRRLPRRFVALDRDGTILHERHYLSRVEDVELLPGAADGLRRMRALGLGLVVVSNQSGIARGYLDEGRLQEIHARLRELLLAEDVSLDGIYACPHLPEDDCACRKPRGGLMTAAAAELAFDPGEAFVIGDKACDVGLGQAVGARTILVRTGYGASEEAALRPDHVVDDLSAAASLLEELLGERGVVA